MRKILVSVLLVVLALSIGVGAFAAFKIPARPQNYVSDYARVLSSGQQGTLNSILRAYEERTTNQIFIGIFDSLQGGSLEDVSIRIAEKWKPGIKGKDNGVLLLFFMRDGKIRIDAGYGLEPVLTDALSNAIIVNEISPLFKKRQYYTGIRNAVHKMTAIISGDLSEEERERYLERYRRSANARRGNPVFSLIFAIIFIIIFIRNPFLAIFLFSGGFSSGGRYGGGFGGFSGGGGGSFGGGGASGSW